MFRMLKLKPPQGWNAVVWELAIVTLGVLVALGAGQLVESWTWQRKVGVVRQSIMGELANDRARWEVNIASAPCLNRDVDALDQWARGQSSEPPRAAVSGIAEAPMYWMHSANWSLAESSQALDHFPLDEQLAFAALYDGIAHRQVDIEKATDLAERVETLASVADDPQGRRELRAALGNLKIKMGSLVWNDAYMRRHFDAVGVKPDRSDFEADLDRIAHCQAGRVMPRR